MLNVRESPSPSLAVTVPIAVSFSLTVKVASEVKVGVNSFTLIIEIDNVCADALVPSLAVTTAL